MDFRFKGLVINVAYEDANAMLAWLSRVFGFRERARYVDANGAVMQAEMLVGDQEVWFSGHGAGYWEKKGRRPDQYLLVWVDDVDAVHAHVTAAGVAAPEPKDQTWGVRNFHVDDPEGYHWSFMQPTGRPYVQVKPVEDGGWKEILAPGMPSVRA